MATSIKLSADDFYELQPSYIGQQINLKISAKVIMRELLDGKDIVTLIPDVVEVVRSENRVNPQEVLLANIDNKLGMMNSPIV